MAKVCSLDMLDKNDTGVICHIGYTDPERLKGGQSDISEVEARLLEMGFIEGATLTVLHFGIWGRDPIAVRINNNNTIMALRRKDAKMIMVQKNVNR